MYVCVHVQVCPTSASVVVMVVMPCTCSSGSRNTRSAPLGAAAGVWTAVYLKMTPRGMGDAMIYTDEWEVLEGR